MVLRPMNVTHMPDTIYKIYCDFDIQGIEHEMEVE